MTTVTSRSGERTSQNSPTRTNHLKPTLGHRKLKDLTRTEDRRLYNEKSKTLSPRSVDYIHTTLQKALAQAVTDDLLPRNVASGERPRSSRN
jgi:integrase